MPVSVLVIGETDREEFREASDALRPTEYVRHVPDLDAAAALLADEETAADVIVLAQAYPGQYPAESIDRLRQLAPLARIVALLGSWCEGESRSGRPVPGVVRVPWHQFPARSARELARLADGFGSVWGLPATAGEDERVLASAERALPQSEGLVAVYSPEFEMYDWLAEAVRRRGQSAVWLRPRQPIHVRGARAAVFDGLECDGEELDTLRRLAARVHPAPVVALMPFPRTQDCDRVRAAGASALLAKPLAIDDLFWHLDPAVP